MSLRGKRTCTFTLKRTFSKKGPMKCVLCMSLGWIKETHSSKVLIVNAEAAHIQRHVGGVASFNVLSLSERISLELWVTCKVGM